MCTKAFFFTLLKLGVIVAQLLTIVSAATKVLTSRDCILNYGILFLSEQQQLNPVTTTTYYFFEDPTSSRGYTSSFQYTGGILFGFFLFPFAGAFVHSTAFREFSAFPLGLSTVFFAASRLPPSPFLPTGARTGAADIFLPPPFLFERCGRHILHLILPAFFSFFYLIRFFCRYHLQPPVRSSWIYIRLFDGEGRRIGGRVPAGGVRDGVWTFLLFSLGL
jgi:hypothetical protein